MTLHSRDEEGRGLRVQEARRMRMKGDEEVQLHRMRKAGVQSRGVREKERDCERIKVIHLL
jgi:hypothetical protein